MFPVLPRLIQRSPFQLTESFSGVWHMITSPEHKRHVMYEIDGLRVPVIGRTHRILNKRTVRRPQDLLDADLLESSE
jgi:hypothetical protein